MNADVATRLMSDLLWTGLLVCLPVIGLALLTGLLVSVLQVITQVQEMSLTFVPKLVVATVAMVVFGPWMLRTITGFCYRLWAGIPNLG